MDMPRRAIKVKSQVDRLASTSYLLRAHTIYHTVYSVEYTHKPRIISLLPSACLSVPSIDLYLYPAIERRDLQTAWPLRRSVGLASIHGPTTCVLSNGFGLRECLLSLTD